MKKDGYIVLQAMVRDTAQSNQHLKIYTAVYGDIDPASMHYAETMPQIMNWLQGKEHWRTPFLISQWKAHKKAIELSEKRWEAQHD